MIVLALFACIPALGCGSTEDPGPTTTSGPAQAQGSGSEPAAPDVAEADPEAVEVITGWIEALSEGDTKGAAGYFAIPSVAENGPTLEIRSAADAVVFNESLPCGAELLSAETVGAFTTATFRLSERPGGDCGAGSGGEASTSFVIEDGLIVEWRRVGAGAPEPGPAEAQGRIT